MYDYRATVVRVIDGDTVIVDVDLGFYMVARMSCRLTGINARELHDAGGAAARDYLAGLLPVGISALVSSVKPDKYAGRFDGIVYNDVPVSVNAQMITAGYAASWDGHGTAPVPPWPIPS